MQAVEADTGAAGIASQFVEGISAQDLQVGKRARGGQVRQQHADVVGVAGEVDQVRVMVERVLQQGGKLAAPARPHSIVFGDHDGVAIGFELAAEIGGQAAAVGIGRIDEQGHVLRVERLFGILGASDALSIV